MRLQPVLLRHAVVRRVVGGLLGWTVLALVGGMSGFSAEAGGSPGIIRFTVDPGRSSVRFEAQATGHTVHGVTQQVSGVVSFDPDDLARKAEVSFQVQAASLETGNKSRDKKMREAHLQTDQHPVIGFRSSKVEAIAPTLRDGETQEMKVTGTLALHGTDKEITFPVKAVRRGADLTVTGETTLRMTDYGIPIPGFLFIKVKDEVKVIFDVVATAAEAGK